MPVAAERRSPRHDGRRGDRDEQDQARRTRPCPGRAPRQPARARAAPAACTAAHECDSPSDASSRVVCDIATRVCGARPRDGEPDGDLCENRAADARARRHEHVPDAREPGARAASCATRSRRCARSTASRSSCSPSRRARYLRAARELRRRTARARFDVVHAHFGLTRLAGARAARRAARRDAARHRPAPPALAARSPARRCRFIDLAAAVSRELARERPAAPAERRRVAVLPVRRRPRPLPPDPARRGARAARARPRRAVPALPADPARPVKRFDRAREVAGDDALLTLGRVPPDEVPLWVNAANAVLVPVRGRGLRARRARGARLRRARARHAGRRPPGGARRDRRDALRAVRRDGVARRRSRRTCGRRTRASTGRARAALFSAERMADARRSSAWRERATVAASRRRYSGAVSA